MDPDLENVTNFEKDGISVQIGIRAQGSSDAYYLLFFVHKGLKKDVEKDKSTQEKDAL